MIALNVKLTRADSIIPPAELYINPAGAGGFFQFAEFLRQPRKTSALQSRALGLTLSSARLGQHPQEQGVAAELWNSSSK